MFDILFFLQGEWHIFFKKVQYKKWVIYKKGSNKILGNYDY